MKLIMLKGLPGSGKTTWAKRFIEENPGYIRVNKDSLRDMFHITTFSALSERMVLDRHNVLIELAIVEGKCKGIIVDNTNFSPKHEKFLRSLAKTYKVEFEIKFFDTPLDECIKNDLKRLNSVGEKVIRKMYNQYLVPKLVNLVKYDPTLPDAIICDIDGTLALHVARGPYEMEKCETDEADPIILGFLKVEYQRGCTIIFVSGRGQEYWDKTVTWLKKHMRPIKYCLYMRSIEDRREDSIIKQEVFDKNIKGKYNVKFVLDDRNRVVDMWRRNGLKCLQVAEGDF